MLTRTIKKKFMRAPVLVVVLTLLLGLIVPGAVGGQEPPVNEPPGGVIPPEVTDYVPHPYVGPATPVEPGDFTSLGTFVPGPGTYTVNTTALPPTLTGPATAINGVVSGGIAVFTFSTVNIAAGVTVNAAGTRPFALLSQGDLTIDGLISGNGGSVSNFSVGTGAPGGAGGSQGGSSDFGDGGGTGGGQGTNDFDGAGGGGFGGAGATGGDHPGSNGPGLGEAGGPAYGDLQTTLEGGSGGGAGGFAGFASCIEEFRRIIRR